MVLAKIAHSRGAFLSGGAQKVNARQSCQRPVPAETIVSVVLPVFNEVVVLDHLYRDVRDVLEREATPFEIVFVNDGSSDGSGELLDRLAKSDPRVNVVHLSRNFGHQAAVHAGLCQATGDAVVIMDSDMQDDPRALSAFLREWRAGYDVVYAIRHKRKEALWKRALFSAFYRVLNLVAETPIPNDAGNFGLVDRRVATVICQLGEQDRFFPGLRSWVGFRQKGLEVERARRRDGRPRVTLRGLFSLAKTAIFSFSSVPLMAFHGIALLSLTVCVLFTTFTLYHKFVTGLAVPGWTSMIIIASFFAR